MSNSTVVIDFLRNVKLWQEQTDRHSHCSLPSPTNLTMVLGEEEEGEGRTLSLILTCPQSASTSTSSLKTLPRMPKLESLQVKNIPILIIFQKHPKLFPKVGLNFAFKAPPSFSPPLILKKLQRSARIQGLSCLKEEDKAIPAHNHNFLLPFAIRPRAFFLKHILYNKVCCQIFILTVNVLFRPFLE